MRQFRSLHGIAVSFVALAAIGTAVLAFGPSPSRAGDLSDLVRHLADAEDESPVAAAPPITQDEAARIWDAFLTSIVKRAGADADVEALRDELFTLLLGDRYEVVAALETPTEDGARWLAEHFQAA